jgi:hypothetical protein
VLLVTPTAKSLEICLDYPFLVNIFFHNSLQSGFDGLLSQFNGLKELMGRPDLSNVLLAKYSKFSDDMQEVEYRNGDGKFLLSIHHLVVDIMLAQDFILNSLSGDQESVLSTLSSMNSKIRDRNPSFFSTLYDETSYLRRTNKNETVQRMSAIAMDVSDYKLTSSVETPKGRVVPDMYFYEAIDLTLVEIADYKNAIEASYPGAKVVGDASLK